jgi:ethanolamine utilization cobalamin adenosyltransferase
VITQADIAALDRNGVLHVPAGSRLTPLARDSAATLGIEIVFDN